MPAKPNAKNWNDLKLMLTALSVAATLGFWNLFAKPQEEPGIAGQLQPRAENNQENPVAAQPAFTGKILLGGKAPQIARVIVSAPQQPQRHHRPAARTRTS